jgi:hypothetical protein
MNRFCRMASRFSGCLAVALLVLAALAVPTRFAFADSGFCDGLCSGYFGFTPGTDAYNACMSGCESCESSCSSYTTGSTDWQNCMDSCGSAYINEASSCPNPFNNPCPINNGNPNGCPGIGCVYKDIFGTNWVCWCVYSNNTCNCPP